MAVTKQPRPVTWSFSARKATLRVEIAAFPVSTGKSRSAQPGHPIIGVGRADWDKAAYTKVVRERSKLS